VVGARFKAPVEAFYDGKDRFLLFGDSPWRGGLLQLMRGLSYSYAPSRPL